MIIETPTVSICNVFKSTFIFVIALISIATQAENLLQSKFEEIICTNKDKYLNASNDLIANQVDSNIRSQLSNFFSETMYVENWNGKILDISSTMTGWNLSIGIGCRIKLQTWNNSFSDLYANTLIPEAGEIADNLTKKRLYDSVKFSGYFVRDSLNVIEEQSLTQRGRILRPEFSFIFRVID